MHTRPPCINTLESPRGLAWASPEAKERKGPPPCQGHQQDELRAHLFPWETPEDSGSKGRHEAGPASGWRLPGAESCVMVAVRPSAAVGPQSLYHNLSRHHLENGRDGSAFPGGCLGSK